MSEADGWPHSPINIESGEHAPFFNTPAAFPSFCWSGRARTSKV